MKIKLLISAKKLEIITFYKMNNVLAGKCIDEMICKSTSSKINVPGRALVIVFSTLG